MEFQIMNGYLHAGCGDDASPARIVVTLTMPYGYNEPHGHVYENGGTHPLTASDRTHSRGGLRAGATTLKAD